MTDRLFVYGTLAPGRCNQHILADLTGIWAPASVRGTLFPESWGTAAGYPGVILADDGDIVSGLVFTSAALANHWSRIDDFEGDGYRRVAVTATLDSGETVKAQIYQLDVGTPPINLNRSE